MNKSYDTHEFKLVPIVSEDGEYFTYLLLPSLLTQEEIEATKTEAMKQYKAINSGFLVVNGEELDAYDDGHESYFIWYVERYYSWEKVPFYEIGL